MKCVSSPAHAAGCHQAVVLICSLKEAELRAEHFYKQFQLANQRHIVLIEELEQNQLSIEQAYEKRLREIKRPCCYYDKIIDELPRAFWHTLLVGKIDFIMKTTNRPKRAVHFWNMWMLTNKKIDPFLLHRKNIVISSSLRLLGFQGFRGTLPY
ncbi:unnamed protein product [Gongylonema pulchrum]|uniref:Glycosyltransferase family 1 protein n=1 Tax=Gongylonema pulchrum TaxID=637853 RepID=A0A183EPQ6_9BILA|nr:unnamed protein product [Gongylonema pulchrum]